MKNFIAVVLCLIIINASAQKQGICGKVIWEEGNQMPGPGKKNTGKGIAREIHVYEMTTMEQTTRQNGFYKEIKTRFVASTVSKADGSYKLKLPPGKYSVFTKEPEGLFANLFDQNGGINTVEVTAGKFVPLEIKVNYKAAY
jgi:hypothetical protein